MQANIDAATAAFTIAEFCHSHKISRSLFYQLVRDGQAPRLMRPRGRVLISREAAAVWRAAMEVEAAQ